MMSHMYSLVNFGGSLKDPEQDLACSEITTIKTQENDPFLVLAITKDLARPGY